ncbi:IS110 family transposase [Ornithinibacillus gellani]|uniref:IS110 family transposase n=1 Tax=Ornithinibacillus gellani TaxID=2293253 RepID=UPI000F4ACD6B|nr:IS110 family transposase [Ornithinibacillus gellani]TQS72156.1 IS110 family transposase [Ornithinibacillus gellani]
MKDNTKYVGLDVSKEKIAVAVADEGRAEPRYYGMIPNSPAAIRTVMKKLGNPDNLKVCYEAGPTGYGIYRYLFSLGIDCEVIAPGLIPKRPGDRVKTDRRDALRLATLYRAGELTPIHVPTEEDEILRDLVRAREDTKEDLLRAKQRLTKFLLRRDINPPNTIKKKWTYAYREWLDKLSFESSTLNIVFQEYLQQLVELEQRMQRFEKEIQKQAEEGFHAPMIQALQVLRGISVLSATALVAEIGSFRRFKKAGQFMAYNGLVPSEESSGEIRKQGKITKTGNKHVRWLLIESAWSYRYKPVVKGNLKKRQEGQPASITAISWKAQQRLHNKFNRLIGRGKAPGKAITAVARELAGFIWAIANEVELARDKEKNAA